MPEELRLEYLGGMQVTRGGAPLTGFVSAKVPALLCYLAMTGRPQFRLVLASLLWGDLPEGDACANLRKALSNLRSLIGPHLIITPHTVVFNRQSAYWMDVEAFSLSVSPPSPCLPHLSAAAELYRGDFLDGFYVRHAPAFEEWVLGQRERLRQSALDLFSNLARHHAAQEEDAAAIEYTARVLALDPWQEDSHREMMALMARSGQRSAALAQYEKCRRALQQELGVEPMAETTALYRRIRALGVPRPHNLPAPTTSFVGREDELAQVARRLADPNCRLLTILGPGGVGKTRLALQAARIAHERVNDAFPDGVYFASLHTADSADALIATLAKSLALPPAARAEPRNELFRHLQTRELLLVLDGFEHLVGAAEFLCTILQHAPRVKLLVTSRQRLHLSGEWSLVLRGLPYAPLGTPSGIEGYSATQLFIQRAQQACPEFSPSTMDLQAITYICELVEGLPLAIELAAAWARTLRCIDIACAIEGGLDALSAFQPDRPPRHQSMRATFEHSWKLLTAADRGILRRAAVFRDGFDSQAARAVAGADLALLTALADKSLLSHGPSGRYEMHELLWQFAAEKLDEAPAERDETRSRHARHYLGEFMAQREQELRGGRQGEAMERVREEISNLRAAWTWATSHKLRREVGGSLVPLAILFEMLGWWQEGEEAFGAAVAELCEGSRGTDDRETEDRVMQGALLAIHGSFCLRTGRLDRARVRLHASLEMLRQEPDSRAERAFPHMGLGLLLNSVGRPADAEEHFRRSLAILRSANDSLLVAFALDYLGEICVENGRPGEARQALEEALALHRAGGEQWGVGRALYGLGRLATELGDLTSAQELLCESVAIFAALGAHDAAARSNCALGEVASAAGKTAQARRLLEGSLPVLERSQNALGVARCRASLARLDRAAGRDEPGESVSADPTRPAFP